MTGRPAHAERGAPERFDDLGLPRDLDVRDVAPAEQEEEQLPGETGDAGDRAPTPRPDHLAGSRPDELEATEEPRWRTGSDGRDKLREVALRERESSSFGKPTPRAGNDETRRSDQVVFTEYEVRGEVARGPGAEKRYRGGAELIEQVAQLRALIGVVEHLRHGVGAYA